MPQNDHPFTRRVGNHVSNPRQTNVRLPYLFSHALLLIDHDLIRIGYAGRQHCSGAFEANDGIPILSP